MRQRGALGLDTWSRPTTPRSSNARSPWTRRDRDQRARSRHVSDRSRRPARTRRAGAPRSDRRSPSRASSRALRAGLRASRRRCDPRRLGADAGIRPGSEAPRPSLPATRQGLRAHKRGGVAAAVEAGADLAGFVLVPESPEAAAEVLPVPDTCSPSRSGSARPARAGPISIRSPARGGKVRGRDTAVLATASESPLTSTCRGKRTIRRTGERAAGVDDRILLAGRLGAGQRRRCDRAGPPMGGRRELRLESAPGRQGSRQDQGLRGGGPRMTTGVTFGDWGGRYVPRP